MKYYFIDEFSAFYRQALNNGPSALFTEAIEYIKSDDKLHKKARNMLREYADENLEDTIFSEVNINRYL